MHYLWEKESVGVGVGRGIFDSKGQNGNETTNKKCSNIIDIGRIKIGLYLQKDLQRPCDFTKNEQ